MGLKGSSGDGERSVDAGITAHGRIIACPSRPSPAGGGYPESRTAPKVLVGTPRRSSCSRPWFTKSMRLAAKSGGGRSKIEVRQVFFRIVVELRYGDLARVLLRHVRDRTSIRGRTVLQSDSDQFHPPCACLINIRLVDLSGFRLILQTSNRTVLQSERGPPDHRTSIRVTIWPTRNGAQ